MEKSVSNHIRKERKLELKLPEIPLHDGDVAAYQANRDTLAPA